MAQRCTLQKVHFSRKTCTFEQKVHFWQRCTLHQRCTFGAKVHLGTKGALLTPKVQRCTLHQRCTFTLKLVFAPKVRFSPKVHVWRKGTTPWNRRCMFGAKGAHLNQRCTFGAKIHLGTKDAVFAQMCTLDQRYTFIPKVHIGPKIHVNAHRLTSIVSVVPSRDPFFPPKGGNSY